MLVGQLGPRDRVALVAYAGSAGLVLPSTPGSEKQTILDALDRLSAGGSTNGGADFRFAAAVAEFGMVLRRSEHRGGASLGGVHKLAKDALGPDANGHRAEFVRLVDAAITIARKEIEKRGNSDKQ
jgi:hypothetical protein